MRRLRLLLVLVSAGAVVPAAGASEALADKNVRDVALRINVRGEA